MTEGVTAVECVDLTYRFGEHRAVDGVSLAVRPGEVFGLLGPNGAGKTTAIRLIVTLLPVQQGAVRVFGVDVRRDPLRARRMLGYVPQQLSADPALTGLENVTLFARLYDVPRRERRRRVTEVLDKVGLGPQARRLVATYSGGMVRRLELAQALVNRPRLLVLDEPTIGLDPVARDEVWDHIGGLVATEGTTVLVTTHYMEEAEQHCDRVALMHLGRLRAAGTPGQLRAAEGEGATLEDVFRHWAGTHLATDTGEDFRAIRSTRRAASGRG
ncbi:ABC transporter ATP-binding protein [Georgenia thermotolerans]|uniref:ABC transporter ATP-binding protein n=1 Tax=Georgenia thermotolerans TaxID=527326 RepID=UPI00186AF694|nr:ATP-binding cassette domain-containing protein [Georgenia thermotolerans]